MTAPCSSVASFTSGSFGTVLVPSITGVLSLHRISFRRPRCSAAKRTGRNTHRLNPRGVSFPQQPSALRDCPRGATDRLGTARRSEEHTSELQSRGHLVCRL